MNEIGKKNIIIFGTGRYGEVAGILLEKRYNIVAYSDNNQDKWNQEFCHKIIIPPSSISECTFDKVIIASQYYVVIAKQLHEMGIKCVETFYYKGLLDQQPNYSDYILFENTFDRLYSKQNYTKNNKVLICAYIFPPLGGPGSQRPTKFVKYLRNFGYEPVVVTVGNDNNKTKRDESLLKDIPPEVEIIRINNDIFFPEQLSETEKTELINIYYGITGSEKWINNYVNRVNNNLNQYQEFFIPDTNICWAIKALNVIQKEINIQEYAACYTTGNPFSIFIIGYYLKKLYGLPWIMDYRDPWTMDDYYNQMVYEERKNTLKLEQILERSLLQYSDAVINVAEGYNEEMLEKSVCNEEKLYCITNGYDEEDFADLDISCDNEIFSMCYNGTLYNRHRDKYDIIIDVLNELIKNQVIDKEKFVWVINGRSEDNKIYDFLKEKDIYHIIRFNNFLTHGESISVAMHSDLLIQFGSDKKRKRTGYSGKIFEYLRMRRPILSISSKDSILTDLMEETGCGRNFAYCDLEEIRDYIQEVYFNWQNKSDNRNLNYDKISKYSRINTTKQLAEVIKKISN
ncbi:MAG: glycosyltransferase family 4 protein [Lachnospiraceae bacterium]|nr:glycosyltransferase family 4 protein [Lachnospiraceae bacterium]